jgi:hypothetical protein
MKLLIEIDYNTSLAIDTANAGPLVECIQHAKLVRKVAKAGRYKYEPVASGSEEEPGTLNITMAPDSAFEAVPEPLLKIDAERRQAEGRWLEYYHKSNALQKEVDELKEKLESIKNNAS